MKTDEDYRRECEQMWKAEADMTAKTQEELDARRKTRDEPRVPVFGLGAALGSLGACMATLVSDSPLAICKQMQASDNAELKLYGYKMEAALMRDWRGK